MLALHNLFVYSRRVETHCLGSPDTFRQVDEILGTPRLVQRIVEEGCCLRHETPTDDDIHRSHMAVPESEAAPGVPESLLVTHYRVGWTIKRAIREWQLRLWAISPDVAPPQRLRSGLSEEVMCATKRAIRPLLKILNAGLLQPLEAERMLACLEVAQRGEDPEAEYQMLCRGKGDWVFGVGAVDSRPLAYRDKVSESRFRSWLSNPVAAGYLRAFRTVLEVIQELSPAAPQPRQKR